MPLLPTMALVVACAVAGHITNSDSIEPQSETATPTTTEQALRAVSPEVLLERSPSQNKTLTVVGTLRNESPNYFKRPRHFVIVGDSGGKVGVRAWLPLTTATSPTTNARPAMSDYLDQKVALTGKLIPNPADPGGPPIFTVESAKVIADPKQ